jgi:hypothetical protein
MVTDNPEAYVLAIAAHIDGWRSATFGWQHDPDPVIAERNKQSAIKAHAAECLRRVVAELHAAGVPTAAAEGLHWCQWCGEGVTTFCRGALTPCPKGLAKATASGVMGMDDAQRAEQRKAAAGALDAHVAEYLGGYELRGDGGDHTPTEFEAALIADAVAGLIGDDEFIRRLAAWDRLRTRPAGVQPSAAPLSMGLLNLLQDFELWSRQVAERPDVPRGVRIAADKISKRAAAALNGNAGVKGGGDA